MYVNYRISLVYKVSFYKNWGNNMKPYEIVSRFYNNDWEKYSSKYVELILNIIKIYHLNVKPILDIACGTGVLASELYNKNFEVSGIDISKDMISVAKENVKLYYIKRDTLE
jgi:2-polyprenyl-3-methyl-5-hydroxy-6-metoxy-1,4-benzoquinol methylase